MIKQTQNNAVIEGILSEVGLEFFPTKNNGEAFPHIRGSIKVKLDQVVNGETHTLEIPIQIFQAQNKKAGGENPAFASVKKVMDEFKSIAAVGEEDADRVRITGASIEMNEYARDGVLTKPYPRIRGSFVSRVRKEDYNPRAEWEGELYFGKMGYQTDREGIETDVFEIQGVSIGWAEKAQIIPIVSMDAAIIPKIESAYEVGDTVPVKCKMLFTVTTERVLEEVEIGDPIETIKTRSVSELVISAMKGAKEGDAALDANDVKVVLEARTARLEQLKAQSLTQAPRGSERKSPNTSAPKVDLGF